MKLSTCADEDNTDALEAEASERGALDAKLAAVLDQQQQQIQILHEVREEVRDLRAQRDPDALLDKSEVAQKLGCSERLVDTLIASGELPSVKVRRLRRIPRKALQAFIQKRAEDTEF